MSVSFKIARIVVIAITWECGCVSSQPSVGSATPVVKTVNGAIVFETGDGATLSLSNVRVCLQTQPTQTGHTTLFI